MDNERGARVNAIVYGLNRAGKTTLIEVLKNKVDWNFDKVEMEDFGSPVEIHTNIKNFIQYQLETCDMNDQATFLLYCTYQQRNRFENVEINFLKEISKEIPVIVLVTNSFIEGRTYADFIQESLVNQYTQIPVFPVLAKSYHAGQFEIDGFGIDEVVYGLKEMIPEGIKKSYERISKYSFTQNQEIAYALVNSFTLRHKCYFKSVVNEYNRVILIINELLKKILFLFKSQVHADVFYSDIEKIVKGCQLKQESSFYTTIISYFNYIPLLLFGQEKDPELSPEEKIIQFFGRNMIEIMTCVWRNEFHSNDEMINAFKRKIEHFTL